MLSVLLLLPIQRNKKVYWAALEPIYFVETEEQKKKKQSFNAWFHLKVLTSIFSVHEEIIFWCEKKSFKPIFGFLCILKKYINTDPMKHDYGVAQLINFIAKSIVLF